MTRRATGDGGRHEAGPREEAGETRWRTRKGGHHDAAPRGKADETAPAPAEGRA